MADVEGLFLRGKDAADRGNYDYAIALFIDVLRIAPDHRNARIALRGCELEMFRNRGGGVTAKAAGVLKGLVPLLKLLFQSGKPERAAESAELYLKNDPTNILVLRRLAQAHLKRGHAEAAADTLEFARQRSPRNISVLRELGEAHYACRAYDKAVRCFQEIVSIKPEDRDATQRAKEIQAESHLKRSGMEGAQSFRESLRDTAKTDQLLKQEHVVRSGDEIGAEAERLQKEIEADPENANLHASLGDAYYNVGRYAEAEKAYARAFQLSKKYGMREKMGNARIRQFEQIEKKCQKEVEESGRAPQAVARLRDARQKRLEFCIKEFSFRRQQHPTDMKLAMRLGQYYYELGGEENIRNAIQQFQQAMSNNALRTQAQLMLGRCFALDPKTLDMAAEQFQQAVDALEVRTGDAAKELLYELGQTYEKLGKAPEALAQYKKIFSIDAAYRDVAKKIQSLG